jgi:uncharacterized paraquat-inducible protein A
MKCPHCGCAVSLFCPSINRGTRRNKCPHCDVSVRARFRHKRKLLSGLGVALLLAITAAVLSPPYRDLLSGVAAFFAAAVGIFALTQIELVSTDSP